MAINGRKWIRRLGVLVLCWLVVLTAALPARAEIELASEAAVLMDARTGQILYEKDCHRRMYPASITKIMTGMLALQNLNPGDTLTVSEAAYCAVPRTSSHIGLEPGTTMTVDQALYALALESANDAANVLGEAVSGSLEAFGEKMTEAAHALGAVDTHFTNANGLPDEKHYTTAYDMALIAAAALNTEGFIRYFGTVDYADSEYHFDNANRMLSGAYHYDGVLMSKTGWTSSAWGTLVTAVQQGDTVLIAVVMKSLATQSKYEDTWALLNYGFGSFERVTVTGEEAAKRLSLGDYRAAAGQSMNWLLPLGASTRDIAFSIAEGSSPRQMTAEQPAVILNVRYGDMVLPNAALLLEKKPTVPDPIPEFLEELPIVEAAAEATGITPAEVVGLGLAAILLLTAFLLYRRQRSRKRQRRVLERRIRAMKKQMDS